MNKPTKALCYITETIYPDVRIAARRAQFLSKLRDCVAEPVVIWGFIAFFWFNPGLQIKYTVVIQINNVYVRCELLLTLDRFVCS